MLTPRPLAGPMHPTRLSQVPLHIRRRFGVRLLEQAAEDGDLLGATLLKRAIERPSDRVYWVPSAAVERVLG